MIVIITEWDTELKCLMVSHGIDYYTDQPVVMQQVPVRSMKDAYFDNEMGHWVISNTGPDVPKDKLKKEFNKCN